jgi:hypothetical protein
MKPSTRTLTSLLAVTASVVIALALAACGGGDSDSGDDVAPSTSGNDDLFTTPGFTDALDAVSGQEGDDAPLLRIQVTSGGAEFQIRDGEQATGYIYSGGDLNPVDVEVIGTGSLEGEDFPLTEVDPAAIDKIDEGVQEASGVDDIKITVLTLEKSALDGKLRWVINAEGGGRTGLVYNADPDGSNVTSPTGDIPGSGDAGGDGSSDAGGSGGGGDTGASGGSVPDAQALADCIQKAGGDVQKIQACTQ